MIDYRSVHHRFKLMMTNLAMVSLLFFAMQTNATEVTAQQWEAIMQQADNTDINQLISTSSTLEQVTDYIQQQPDDVATLLTVRVIKYLAGDGNDYPFVNSEIWLTEQLTSNEQLQMASVDHPEKLLTIASVANQARATLLHNQVQRQAKSYQDKIAIQDWQWQQFIADATNQDYMALAIACEKLSEADQQWLKASLIESPTFADVNNQLLITLLSASKQPNTPLVINTEQQLFNKLMTNGADQYSYQAIPLMAKRLPNTLAVDSFKLAAKNKPLTSAVLNQLATKFADHQNAQQYLLTQLNDKSVSFLAAAAIVRSKSPELKDKARKMAQSKQGTVAKKALSVFSSEELQ